MIEAYGQQFDDKFVTTFPGWNGQEEYYLSTMNSGARIFTVIRGTKDQAMELVKRGMAKYLGSNQ